MLCSCAQVRAEGALHGKCRSITSALLPAAELLLRGTMVLRLGAWQQSKELKYAHRGIEEARMHSHVGTLLAANELHSQSAPAKC